MFSTTIATWLASSLGRLIIIGLAITGAILIPVTVYQTIHITGLSFPFPIFGTVTLVEGLAHKVETADARIKKAEERTIALSNEYTRRTNDLKLAGETAVAAQKAKTLAAEQALAIELAKNKQFNSNLMRILDNAKPGDERPLGPTVLQYLNGLRRRR